MNVAAESTAWMDGSWDDDRGLYRSPRSGRHLVRETVWYALGLLQRGDTDRAIRALGAVLDQQYAAPSRIYDGTFRRTPEDPDPGREARIWADYDPNWRQFIGTTLALVLEHDLPEALRARIDGAVLRCAQTEPPDRVPASYTNIALMRAWLDAYAGERFGDDDRRARGESFALDVFARFERLGAFDEYNSPTYYGVDLYALGLWRTRPPDPTWAEMAERMEHALWTDVAARYHATLRNLCGPFDRAYGMDMRSYAALLGLCIRCVVPPERAPFPDLSGTFGHADDAAFGPCIGPVGVNVTASAVLDPFSGEHVASRTIGERTYSSWLGERAMAGGCDAQRTRRGSGQYHAATMHFPDAWIRVRHDGPLDALARPGELEVIAHGDAAIEFDVAPRVVVDGATWHLDGADIAVSTDASWHAVSDTRIDVAGPARVELRIV